MTSQGQFLVANFAVVALFISSWVHSEFLFANRPRWLRNAAFGAVMGLGAIASMALAVPTTAGMLVDLRASLLALASFFGGPIAGLVAVVIAIGYRLVLGGLTAWAGAVGIITAALAGWMVSRMTRGRVPALWSAGLLALTVACVSPALTMALHVFGVFPGIQPSGLAFGLNAAATALSAFFIMRHRVLERERNLLRAAFMQSPDFQYVKNLQGRFAAANASVVAYNGFARERDMLGKTDFDLTDSARAATLMEAEQQLFRTGRPITDDEEKLPGEHGEDAWFSTSKVALYDDDGEPIGLAGVTRNITARKRLEGDVIDSRNQLNYVLSEMSDGIAMFNAQGTLVYRNSQYSSLFPLTTDVRRPGQHIRTILEAVLATGEQLVPAGSEHEWLESIVSSLDRESEEEVKLYDGRWLHLRTRPTADGQALVVVSDVTKIRQAEVALKAMTEQLRLLATTDGLTSLTNRRAFDMALDSELARARREGRPLSLLLADVDRFKAYNDIYGHLMGDEVLKSVGICLRQAVQRPGDTAARYGGEEFVAILPETDEDGAFFIADAFRQSLYAMGIPHRGGDKGVVTVSVGIATFTERDEGINAIELVRRADEALYNAKGAGRDRVTGWRPRYDVRPVGGMRA
ncbi:MAG: diguanylate cyclase [Hyphomicrobiales bacterium]|nr:MAG: diguanylate cyclase [Hyphomicrobiales bacterium]